MPGSTRASETGKEVMFGSTQTKFVGSVQKVESNKLYSRELSIAKF